MLTELKRCNSIGNIDGLLFLISIIAGKEKISRHEISNRCALENGVSINCPGAIAFLQYLGLVSVELDSVASTDKMDSISRENRDGIVQAIVTICISKLTEDGIFDSEVTGFDAEKGHLTIKRSAFPLAYAAIRNFLINAGALDNEENGEIGISGEYENDWTSQLRSRRKTFTLEQLLKQKEEQSQRGLEAEEFVLSLEKKRLPSKANRIKRISDFDVSAGYDIVSFADEDSNHYDRFMEVKCYLGSPRFFWSENEIDVAKIKGKNYILCIVDYEKMHEPGYEPEYIEAPYDVIFEGDTWMVNPSSYRVQKVE